MANVSYFQYPCALFHYLFICFHIYSPDTAPEPSIIVTPRGNSDMRAAVLTEQVPFILIPHLSEFHMILSSIEGQEKCKK